mmetsp:Transcript_17982/g.41987  ORF Transcript_17982/g.41987 Transcript_17982/m.41987 type:complete len:200 (+) Transcript_17982:76-675(+)
MSEQPTFPNYAAANGSVQDLDDEFLLEAKLSGWFPANDMYGRPYFWNLKDGSTNWTMDNSEVDPALGKPKPKSRIPPRERPGLPKRRPKRGQPAQQPQQPQGQIAPRASVPQDARAAVPGLEPPAEQPEVVYVRTAPPEQDAELLKAMDTSKNMWWAQEVRKAKWNVLTGPSSSLALGRMPLPCACLSSVKGPPLPDIV